MAELFVVCDTYDLSITILIAGSKDFKKSLKLSQQVNV